MTDCQTYFLNEVVDNYMLDRQISKKKYFAAYSVMAKKEWQKLFRNTLWSVQSQWMPLKQGSPYPYIDLPAGTSRLFSVSVTDRCNLLQPLFYNNQLNVVDKPAVKKCGCKENCECSGCCEAANSMTYTTKLLFTYAGTEYFQKTWQEVCKNGDILEYSETPTKQYNNTTGDAGDYNDDFNDDYDIAAPPFSDLTIVTVKSQRKICKVEVLPCGCVAETPENTEALNSNCGCNLNFGCCAKRKHCRQFFENINNNYYGEAKLSECGNKIYYKPSHHWRKVSDVEFPEWLLVSFQTNGLPKLGSVLVPDYSLDTMETGLYYRSIRFNSSIPAGTKTEAKYQYEDERSQLTAFLNPISLITLGEIQDISIRW